MKPLFLDNGFHGWSTTTIWGNRWPTAFTSPSPIRVSTNGADLLVRELLHYGISAITLETTGSCRKEGLRACVSMVGEEPLRCCSKDRLRTGSGEDHAGTRIVSTGCRFRHLAQARLPPRILVSAQSIPGTVPARNSPAVDRPEGEGWLGSTTVSAGMRIACLLSVVLIGPDGRVGRPGAGQRQRRQPATELRLHPSRCRARNRDRHRCACGSIATSIGHCLGRRQPCPVSRPFRFRIATPVRARSSNRFRTCLKTDARLVVVDDRGRAARSPVPDFRALPWLG